MTEKGLKVRPHGWLSSEWFSPSDTPGIAFPFYLAHPRLMRLERKMIIDVEGGTHAGMHAHPSPRGRPRDAALLCAAPRSPLAAPVRPFIDSLSELLSARSGQPEFRPASAALVRAKPSGRGFRRDLRGVADAALELAQALRGLAGVEEAAIRGRADGGDRQAQAGADAADRGRAAALAPHHARRALPEEARALFGRCAARLRPRSAAHLLQQSAAPAFAAGGGLHPPPPRRHPPAGVEMDRRVSAHARPGARRDDRALPRV